MVEHVRRIVIGIPAGGGAVRRCQVAVGADALGLAEICPSTNSDAVAAAVPLAKQFRFGRIVLGSILGCSHAVIGCASTSVAPRPAPGSAAAPRSRCVPMPGATVSTAIPPTTTSPRSGSPCLPPHNGGRNAYPQHLAT